MFLSNDIYNVSLVQLFDVVLFEKVRYETGIFEKAKYLIKTVKKCYKGVYFIL